MESKKINQMNLLDAFQIGRRVYAFLNITRGQFSAYANEIEDIRIIATGCQPHYDAEIPYYPYAVVVFSTQKGAGEK